jgi:hypothetical protein
LATLITGGRHGRRRPLRSVLGRSGAKAELTLGDIKQSLGSLTAIGAKVGGARYSGRTPHAWLSALGRRPLVARPNLRDRPGPTGCGPVRKVCNEEVADAGTPSVLLPTVGAKMPAVEQRQAAWGSQSPFAKICQLF